MAAAGIVFICGIASFFLGLQTTSFAFGKLFNRRLRKQLTAVTGNRLWQVFLLSVLFTGVVQSSSAVTVLGVCLVNAGVMNIADAVALTLGANVGTTVTAQLISLSLRESIVWLLVVGLGAIVISLVASARRRQFFLAGLAVCGLGLLLTGFELLQTALQALSRLAIFAAILNWMRGGLFKSFAGGFLITAVVQSSSLVIASIVSLLRQGHFGLDVALYAMLGSNVGTSVTTLLAMVGGTKAGKAAALANLVFNLISVVLFLPFVGLLRLLVVTSSLDPGRQLANAHTFFNLLTALAVLPFVPWLAGVLLQIAELFSPRAD